MTTSLYSCKPRLVGHAEIFFPERFEESPAPRDLYLINPRDKVPEIVSQFLGRLNPRNLSDFWGR